MNRRLFLAGAALSAPLGGLAFAQTPPRGRFDATLAYSAARGPSALLIARHGVVMAEAYVGANTATRWDLGQAGRMFTPILAAALAEDRLLNLSEPVAMTLGDWGADPVKSTITIRALLNGSSGIGSNRNGEDLTLADALALEPQAAPGQRFIDSAAPYLLFGEIAKRKLLARGANIDLGSYLNVRVLDEIRCTPMNWSRTREGAPRLDGGMQTSLRAWAQAGELIRRDGVYRAQEVVDREAISEARRGSFAEPRAGMGLWLTGAARGPAPNMAIDSDLWRAAPAPPLDLAMAAGADGQRLYIAPSEGLLIARLGRDGDHWSDAEFIGAVMREI
jgi:CubicO group peptidase (beta-lactamase class C family)